MESDLQELTDRYRNDERDHGNSSPWVMLNMIASIDGAVAVDGLSGGLGNEADLAVFVTLRGLADAILVGAGTARAEGYKVPNPAEEVAEARAERGQLRRPVIALVSRSMRLDLDSSLFADSSYRPIVITSESADPDLVVATSQVSDVIVAGGKEVDLQEAVAELAQRTGPLILAEGGPTLNAQLATEDLFDEVCSTTSPLLVGGQGGRMLANGSDHPPRRFDIDRAVQARGLLFTRYLRTR